jgi:predicted HTH domain antitoxin
MTIHFDIPQNIEEQIRSSGVDPTQMAKELFLVDLYRKEQITHHQLAEALGLDRYETDGILKRHGVGIELSLEEFRSQVDSLRELRRQ